MDHDLLLDLRHLDDPEPPRFGDLWAEEAAQRAAQARSRRARLVAGAVLAVALVAGVGLTALGSNGAPATIESASTPPPTDAELAPDESTSIPPDSTPGTTVPAGEQPPATAPAPAQPSTTVAGPAPTVPGVAPPPGGGPSATDPPQGAPVTPPVVATGRPPDGSKAAPAGLRLTLTLDSDRVQAGASVRGKVRFENNRTTAVTLVGGGCDAFPTMLYRDGKFAADNPRCPASYEKVVAPGEVVESPVQAWADQGLRAGTYDVFSVITLREDSITIHSDRHVATVVRS